MISAMTLDPRTPILVGQGQISQHTDDLATALDPIGLMATAVEAAIRDATPRGINQVDAIFAVRSLSTKHTNPALGVSQRLGISALRCAITPHGGNMPQALVNLAAQQIADGEMDIAILVGAEATRSRNRARRNAFELSWSVGKSGDAMPEAVGEDLLMNHAIEIDRKIGMPIQIYPMFETAIRAASGRGVDEHQQYIGELWSRFSHVAAKNKKAWKQRSYSANEIITASTTNRMVGFPYTKLMNSNNDVDMSAALIICSVERAESLGIAREKWVFIHSGTDCHEHNYVSHRDNFAETPAVRLGGEMALLLANKTIAEIDIVDLYSCFPSAVQLGAASLGLEIESQLTRTGGLSFNGGPWNNYVMHAISTVMCDLRDAPQQTALVWANGGYATKHAFGIYAMTPPVNGFRHGSPQKIVDSLPRRDVADAAQAVGPATIEAYSVMHDREGTAETVNSAVILADGRRAWATSSEKDLATAMTSGEWVGKPTTLTSDGALHC